MAVSNSSAVPACPLFKCSICLPTLFSVCLPPCVTSLTYSSASTVFPIQVTHRHASQGVPGCLMGVSLSGPQAFSTQGNPECPNRAIVDIWGRIILWGGVVLCIVGCLVAFLASADWISHLPLHSVTTKVSVDTARCPLGGKSALVENR